MKERPEGDRFISWQQLVGLVGVGFGFGWKWAALILCVDGLADYGIRLWHHRRAYSDREAR